MRIIIPTLIISPSCGEKQMRTNKKIPGGASSTKKWTLSVFGVEL